MIREAGEASIQDDLLARATAGEEHAIEQLLLAHYDALERRIERRIPIPMRGFLAPEDVIQDTFVLVFRGIDSFDRSLPGGFSSWLLTIADNRLAETVRSFRALKRGGGVRALSAELGIRSGTAEDLLGVLAQIRRTPSQSAARIEAARCLCDALANISDDYREALTLRYFEGLSVAETAARMNRTERSVHMLCHRALRCLGDILGSSSAYLSR